MELNWSQQQLSEWLDKTEQGGAGPRERNSRPGEAKIKELSLQIERLMADQAKARKQLDAEMTETHVNQIALEKVCTSPLF